MRSARIVLHHHRCMLSYSKRPLSRECVQSLTFFFSSCPKNAISTSKSYQKATMCGWCTFPVPFDQFTKRCSLLSWKWITCGLLALFLSSFGASCLALQFLQNGYAIHTFRNAKEFRIACLHILKVRCGCGKNRVYPKWKWTKERTKGSNERVGTEHARYRKLSWATNVQRVAELYNPVKCQLQI